MTIGKSMRIKLPANKLEAMQFKRVVQMLQHLEPYQINDMEDELEAQIMEQERFQRLADIKYGLQEKE